MEDQLNKIKWDIVGLSEVRRRGESQITLRSGHLFHYKGDDNLSQSGVGFMVNKRHVANRIEIKCLSARVIYLTYRLNTQYNIKIVQTYASTSSSEEDGSSTHSTTALMRPYRSGQHTTSF